MMKGDEMIPIPADFLSCLREPLEWGDLRFAYDRQFVGAKTLIDHACKGGRISGEDLGDTP